MLGHLFTLILGILVGAVAMVVIAPSVFSRRARFFLGCILAMFALACFLGALPSESPRTARPRTLILHHHYVTADESAPAQSLPIALVGILAVAALLVLRRSEAENPAPLTVAGMFALACGIVAARFVVEKAAANESVASAFGVLWLAPALGVRAALVDPRESRKARFARLARLAMLLRTPVIAATLLATYFDLGSHFSLARIARFEIPGVDERVLCGPLDVLQLSFLVALPQLVLWPLAMAAVATFSAGALEILAGSRLESRLRAR